MEPVTSRLFVALNPTDPVRDSLAELRDEIPRMQWTPLERIHLTLRFLGEQPAEALEKITTALETVRVKSFFLEVEGVGGFPDRGNWRVLWAGVGRSHPLLHQLRQQVDDALLGAGIQFELRPFVPHLTLGRCAEAPVAAVKQWARRHRDFTGPLWPISSFALMLSEPSMTGGRLHTLFREYPLGTLS
jgi:RNA 2',3'-cyclic 3'-phosphodiesterase